MHFQLLKDLAEIVLGGSATAATRQVALNIRVGSAAVGNKKAERSWSELTNTVGHLPHQVVVVQGESIEKAQVANFRRNRPKKKVVMDLEKVQI
jgi:hypothetical protein